MKITLPLTFDIDVALWADEYGITGTEAEADAVKVITRAATEKALSDIITQQWPMMAGHAVIVGTPETLLSAAQWTTETAAAAVRAMEPAQRDRLSDALRDLDESATSDTIIDSVRASVAAQDYPQDEPYPVAVLFTTMEFDNGHFVHGDYGTVVFLDGNKDENVEFNLMSEFTDLYGTVGGDAGVLVDLRAGTIEFDDYISNLTYKLPTERA